MTDTIAAIATAFGEAAVGIVRISGPQAINIVDQVLKNRSIKRKSVKEWASHTLHLDEVWDPVTHEIIDEVLVAVMWAPRSYTGEDVIELQGHGGRFILQQILQVVLRAGARMAEPGEFTRRAFLNGCIDLAQAEAVIDLIKARSDAACRLAVHQLKGRLSKHINTLKEKLISLAADMEAVIDFPEEGIMVNKNNIEKLTEINVELSRILQNARGGRAIREGIRVVIIGRPNVGKSSLWNALIGEDRAIVTDIAGTTRDLIEEEIVFQGVPIRLVDTAGIRETVNLVEKIGVDKAKEMLKRGQLVIVVLDVSEEIGNEDKKVVDLVSDIPVLIVANKTDLYQQKISAEELEQLFPERKIIWASMKEGWGIDEIKKSIVNMVVGNIMEDSEEILLSSIRQEEALNRCLTACKSALMAMQQELPNECVLIDINEALNNLGEITGEAVSEQVLDKIFSEFCIGK